MSQLRNEDGRQVRTAGDTWKTGRLGQALSPTQLKVAARLIETDEPTNRRVARDLGMSEDSVRKHVSSIYRKLGVNTRLGMYLALHERPPMPTPKICRHCKQPVSEAPSYAPHPWVHTQSMTWWCPPKTMAEPKVDTAR